MDDIHAGIGFSEFLTGILSIAFAAWSLALNGARKDLKEIRIEFHDSMKQLTAEVTRLREELNGISTRVTRVEVDNAHLHMARRQEHQE